MGSSLCLSQAQTQTHTDTQREGARDTKLRYITPKVPCASQGWAAPPSMGATEWPAVCLEASLRLIAATCMSHNSYPLVHAVYPNSARMFLSSCAQRVAISPSVNFDM